MIRPKLRERPKCRELCSCGQVIEGDKPPFVFFTAASGRPTMRVVVVNGVEVHRCKILTTIR